MYGGVCNVTTGMGSCWLSNTPTPLRYTDNMVDPYRTRILLRDWALRSARYSGWAATRECRVLEADTQSRNIVAELRVAHGCVAAKPLFGSDRASRLLDRWLPCEVDIAMTP